jgi:hypothetical protein
MRVSVDEGGSEESVAEVARGVVALLRPPPQVFSITLGGESANLGDARAFDA